MNGRLSELVKVACQALIREADIKACQLRTQHDAQAVEYRRKRDRELADTRYRQNALLPIHNLPVEIFSNVLILVAQGESVIRYWKLQSLASVAQYWKQVVLSTPQLWASWHEAMSPTQRRWSLCRSRTVPVDIYLDSYDGSGRPPFVKAILPHSGRWRTLTGVGVPSEGIQKLDAPVLQSLRLSKSGD